ncbi:hypothetical protein COT42_02270 [Candidatus Saganbacteria bacterium CG08_land_8_20_14_0_20_45_16]|uniref:BPL/LPL catalytic domain-containing protein n=1 Tax=Candidatus Saganbacteria bacterium CG08_land_8_20_14_0_20_45_16 TaxID=2014293 RepID=A0A2H0Y0B9_UNCSA|nr:MAG: hypothetical protein COT42_02270 [Candidatus Saganbacteria bacterium CG08_land_8_20_14_0_20_45_16]
MKTWQFIISKPASGRENMELDLKLFREATEPIIRIYSWAHQCISVGYAQKIDELLVLAKTSELGWEIVKRPTGGGIVFHNEAEVTFSVVAGLDDLPAGLLPSYYKVSEAVLEALRMIGVAAQIKASPTITVGDGGMNPLPVAEEKGVRSLCFSYPAEYEIVCQGKKIVGSAQKRGRAKLLQQGSIFVKNPGLEILQVLKNPAGEVKAISLEEVLGRVPCFDELAKALKTSFQKVLGVEFKQ